MKQEENPVEPIIKTEKTGTVTLIGINRPDVRNCINTDAATELSAAIEAFENDPESPIAVLYGVGGNFSAGYDLKELSDDPENVTNILMRSEGAMVIFVTSGCCGLKSIAFLNSNFRVRLDE